MKGAGTRRNEASLDRLVHKSKRLREKSAHLCRSSWETELSHRRRSSCQPESEAEGPKIGSVNRSKTAENVAHHGHSRLLPHTSLICSFSSSEIKYNLCWQHNKYTEKSSSRIPTQLLVQDVELSEKPAAKSSYRKLFEFNAL